MYSVPDRIPFARFFLLVLTEHLAFAIPVLGMLVLLGFFGLGSWAGIVLGGWIANRYMAS
jgi:hypothetical protein